MFVPLRYQVTESDCFPTSVLNALAWLFERDELPGAVVQRVYAYSLDGIEHGAAGAYTSEHAALALLDWLTQFKTRSFSVAAHLVHGRDVHLRSASRILRWLRRGGVAVLDVVETPATVHSILALRVHNCHLDFWDPYLRSLKYDYGPGALRLDSDGNTPNLRLLSSALDTARERAYALGPPQNRAALLIRRRISRAATARHVRRRALR